MLMLMNVDEICVYQQWQSSNNEIHVKGPAISAVLFAALNQPARTCIGDFAISPTVCHHVPAEISCVYIYSNVLFLFTHTFSC